MRQGAWERKERHLQGREREKKGICNKGVREKGKAYICTSAWERKERHRQGIKSGRTRCGTPSSVVSISTSNIF